MNEADALEIVQHAVWTVMAAAGPAVAVAMAVGLVVALFQALTQIQEMTLVFVPKILAIFVAMLVALPFKLMLFVLADGWNLLIGSLAASFAT